MLTQSVMSRSTAVNKLWLLCMFWRMSLVRHDFGHIFCTCINFTISFFTVKFFDLSVNFQIKVYFSLQEQRLKTIKFFQLLKFFPRVARREVSLDQEEGFPVCGFHTFLRFLMKLRSRNETKVWAGFIKNTKIFVVLMFILFGNDLPVRFLRSNHWERQQDWII